MLILSRRGTLLAGAGTLLAGLGGGQGRAARLGELEEVPPRPLPEFGFTDAEGQPRRVADFAGKGLIVNFWATWCVPCVAEMPALDRAQAALEADGILVLPLSSDRGGKPVVEKFYAEKGISRLGLWLDPRGAAGRALGIRGLPTTVVVDRAGRECARLEGAAEWDKPEMLEQLRRIFGPAPATPPGLVEQERT